MKPTGPTCYIPRLEMTMKEMPEKYHEALWELTGKGRSPKSVQAAVSYIEGRCTQRDAGEAFGVTKETVRRLVREFIDRGYVTLEYVRENCIRKGKGRFGEFTNGELRAWEQPDSSGKERV